MDGCTACTVYRTVLYLDMGFVNGWIYCQRLRDLGDLGWA